MTICNRVIHPAQQVCSFTSELLSDFQVNDTWSWELVIFNWYFFDVIPPPYLLQTDQYPLIHLEDLLL